jgi:four helix bundle protein
MTNIDNLLVYKKAYDLAIKVSTEAQKIENLYFREQLFRSITSVPANLAEMKGYRTDRYTKCKIRIVLAEITEAEYWVNYFRDIKLLNENWCNEILIDIIEIRKMLCGFMKAMNIREEIREKTKIEKT